MNATASRADVAPRAAFDELLRRLPPVETFHVKDEPETYGARAYVAAKAGRRCRGRSFNSWKHGWSPMQEFFDARQILGTIGFCHNYLVSNEHERQVLEAAGRRRVHAVGLPFIYVDEAPPPRLPESLLIMPTHSFVRRVRRDGNDEVKPQRIDDRASFEYALSLRPSAGMVVLCLYASDYERTRELRREYAERGVFAIRGASGSDRNALLRMWRLFHSFEYVTTNGFGSQLVYGSLCGCKVSVGGHYFEYELEDLLEIGHPADRMDALQALVDFYREANMRERFGFLFADDPLRGRNHYDWAAEQAGMPCRRSYDEICDLLEDGLPARVIGYAGRAVDKVKRLLRRAPARGARG